MSEVLKEGENTVIRPGMSVVASMAEDFKQELQSVINESQGKLVIDLLGVDMVDSVGLGVIIATHNTLTRNGRNLKVINVSNDIYTLFSTMRLNRRFQVEKV